MRRFEKTTDADSVIGLIITLHIDYFQFGKTTFEMLPQNVQPLV